MPPKTTFRRGRSAESQARRLPGISQDGGGVLRFGLAVSSGALVLVWLVVVGFDQDLFVSPSSSSDAPQQPSGRRNSSTHGSVDVPLSPPEPSLSSLHSPPRGVLPVPAATLSAAATASAITPSNATSTATSSATSTAFSSASSTTTPAGSSPVPWVATSGSRGPSDLASDSDSGSNAHSSEIEPSRDGSSSVIGGPLTSVPTPSLGAAPTPRAPLPKSHKNFPPPLLFLKGFLQTEASSSQPSQKAPPHAPGQGQGPGPGETQAGSHGQAAATFHEPKDHHAQKRSPLGKQCRGPLTHGVSVDCAGASTGGCSSPCPRNAECQQRRECGGRHACVCQRGFSNGTICDGRLVQCTPRPRRAVAFKLITPRGEGSCLDGSAPKYYLLRGQGSGKDSWVLYMRGGAWCRDWHACVYRARIDMGSSKPLNETREGEYPFLYGRGLLSPNPEENPEFYNWNVVMVPYCDGGARLGGRGRVTIGGTTLHMEGQQTLSRVLQDLLQRQGLDRAKNVVFMGASAGAQTVSVLCDWMRGQVPSSARAKCLMDAGLFLNTRDVQGGLFLEEMMQELEELHFTNLSISSECRAAHRTETWRCIMAEVSVRFLKTPVFVFNHLYDYMAFRIVYRRYPKAAPTAADILSCIESKGKECATQDYKGYTEYGKEMKKRIEEIARMKDPKDFGSFLYAGASHGTAGGSTWNSLWINGTSAREAFVKWYFD